MNENDMGLSLEIEGLLHSSSILKQNNKNEHFVCFEQVVAKVSLIVLQKAAFCHSIMLHEVVYCPYISSSCIEVSGFEKFYCSRKGCIVLLLTGALFNCK